jgi:hypothetical protein
MHVVYLSPGFPAEMPLFVRGLAEVGAKVFGVGDQPLQAVPPDARAALHDYLQVRSFDDEAAVTAEVRKWLRGRSIDRVEALWERLMYLAALQHVVGSGAKWIPLECAQYSAAREPTQATERVRCRVIPRNRYVVSTTPPAQTARISLKSGRISKFIRIETQSHRKYRSRHRRPVPALHGGDRPSTHC